MKRIVNINGKTKEEVLISKLEIENRDLKRQITELNQALQLQQGGVSSSYSKKYAFEQIEQMLIEKLADFLDCEDVLVQETTADIKDPVKREESFLHIRMAQAAMREYKLTMFGI